MTEEQKIVLSARIKNVAYILESSENTYVINELNSISDELLKNGEIAKELYHEADVDPKGIKN
jgi:hypothetical protein